MSNHEVVDLTSEDVTEKRKCLKVQLSPDPPPGVDRDVWKSLPDSIKKELSGSQVLASQSQEPPRKVSRCNGPDTVKIVGQASEDCSGEVEKECIKVSKPEFIDVDVWQSLPREIKSELVEKADRGYSWKQWNGKKLPVEECIKSSFTLKPSSTWLFSVPDDDSINNLSRKEIENFDRSARHCSEKMFEDQRFLPNLRTLSGSTKSAGESSTKRKCSCNVLAKLRTVYKNNANQGRKYFGCGSYPRKCNYFHWANQNEWEHSKRHHTYVWKRPSVSFGVQPKMVNQYDDENKPVFSGSDVCQGSVGDCWFLSALVVVSERQDLIRKLIVSTEWSKTGGPYHFRLFHDMKWRHIVVDDFLPYVKNKKGNFSLAFTRARNSQLWIPLFEKAYAKAHGSYAAISGGWVSEGLFDLTGYPTETILLGGKRSQIDLIWRKLLSYSDHKFPMGAGCTNPGKGSGLVGGHAYSILECKEVYNTKVGEQLKISKFFPGAQSSSSSRASQISNPRKNLRMLKLRNPWGRVEWKGSFSTKSDAWTKTLLKTLKHTSANDGTFWIEYGDFLAHFSSGEIDICKAHIGWYSALFDDSFSQRNWMSDNILEICAPLGNTWTYITVAQPTKRGKFDGKYFYSDISFILARVKSDEGKYKVMSTQMLRLSGKCKAHHVDVLLDGTSDTSFTSYLLIPFSISRSAMRQHLKSDYSIRLFSAKPLQSRKLASHGEIALHALHLSIYEVGMNLNDSIIISRLDLSRFVETASSHLIKVESPSCCLIIAVNDSPNRSLEVQFLLHGPEEGSSNSVDNKPLPRYVVPPKSQQVLTAVSKTLSFEYNIDLYGRKQSLFVFTNLSVKEGHNVSQPSRGNLNFTPMCHPQAILFSERKSA